MYKMLAKQIFAGLEAVEDGALPHGDRVPGPCARQYTRKERSPFLAFRLSYEKVAVMGRRRPTPGRLLLPGQKRRIQIPPLILVEIPNITRYCPLLRANPSEPVNHQAGNPRSHSPEDFGGLDPSGSAFTDIALCRLLTCNTAELTDCLGVCVVSPN